MLKSRLLSRLGRSRVHASNIDHDLFDAVIAILNDQPVWDRALNSERALENVVHSATYYGVHQPFSPDEQNLVDFLCKHLSGRQMATYAWGVYTDAKSRKAA